MRDHDHFLEQALVEEGRLAPDQVTRIRRFMDEHDVDLVDAVTRLEAVPPLDVCMTKAGVCEAPYVELRDYEPCFANTQLLPRSIAERYQAFPLFVIDGVLTLAMDDPLNLEATDQVRQITKCEVDAVLVDRASLRSLITRAYSLSHGSGDAGTPVVELDDAASLSESSQPVVAAVNQMLADAVDQRASDVHINPDETVMHLRYRIDGVLQERQGPPLSMHPAIVQRLKVMANLDLTQTRRPQDGKFRFRHGRMQVDVRFSTVPTVCGENVVLRLLANTQSFPDFHSLGLPAPMALDLEELLEQPYGMFLVTGPTGSGKTTTLYTALARLNDPSSNILTIEDPVEIRLPYVRQIQVHTEIGLTFANALRSILRQDPDVILVGEVRDNETATIAIQAALTGHMVLSTVHTNDSVGAVARMRDFGLPSFVINSAVLGVMAQRLVRRVCSYCVGPESPDELTRRRFRIAGDVEGFVSGKGCARCGQSGYRGRVGIYELLKFTPRVKAAVEEGGSVDLIRQVAQREGMRLMWQDGLDKARLGQTTLLEVSKAASIVDVSEPAMPVEPLLGVAA